MGNKNSKGRNVPNDPKAKPGVWQITDNGKKDSVVDNQPTYESRFIHQLKNQFEGNMEMFILDQLMLSVIFFENYESHTYEYQKSNYISNTEMMFNQKLCMDQKTIIMPDIMFTLVNERIMFKPYHGPRKDHTEPLIPQRLFITHENIEMLDDEEIDYTQIDKPNVTVITEKSNNEGYAKLKVHENLKKLSNSSENSSIKVKLGFEMSESTTDDSTEISESKDEVDEEDPYVAVNKIKTPHGFYSQRIYSDLPSKWIKAVEVENYISDDDDIDDEEEETNNNTISKSNDDQLYITKYYCDSTVFMKYFVAMFHQKLGAMLSFDENAISNEKHMPGTIFCTKSDMFDCEENFEILPSIQMSWPTLFTLNELQERQRKIFIDNARNKRYQWPTQTMLNDIKNLKTVIIAKGFTPKKTENSETNLEWEVMFPKAERYLMSKMSNAQIKLFLIIVTIFKTFIEPITEKKGLLIEHIRTFMFYQCERSGVDWNMRLLGTKLMDLLKDFYRHLGKSRLNDYFIKSKNHFENIPGVYLQKAQENFHNITEHPVMFLITALRNLSYTNQQNFYPLLDYSKLIDIIKSDGVKFVNPNVHNLIQRQKSVQNKQKEETLDRTQKYEKRKLETSLSKHKKEKELKKQKENKNNQQVPVGSVDSIDYKFEKYNTDDVMKRKTILEFFMDHFMKIAEISLKLKHPSQARFYAKQAEYLCELMDGGLVETIEKYKSTIKTLQDKCAFRVASQQPDLPPDIPVRNQEFQLSGTSFNLQNVSNNYNEGFRC